ncbi:Transcription factor E2F6 [Dissostichus eleginoides]|uniref:Transcription factor E2F6 n=1 Tax=Dissostichus eleginoides TaxID=100907 RepID=A0AAD9BUB5_DISEL|nr:Transcription factor E2F6 [Dissostichus eleginoides]
MVKCVVSGCPNRSNVNPGIYNHSLPSKRFFNFPADTARVKVWLAALRETEKHDSAEQHQICEDHFLPRTSPQRGSKVTPSPSCPPAWRGPWESSTPGGPRSSCEELISGQNDTRASEEIESPDQTVQQIQCVIYLSLGLLTQRFLELLLAAPDGVVDLGQVTASLQTRRRRVYDITAVLEGISVLQRQSVNHFKWIGSTSISSFLWQNQQKLQRELDSLKLVEDTLDSLIKSCAQQLFSMTDDLDNATYPFRSLPKQEVFFNFCTSAYVTHEDVGRLAAFQQQTVIVVKAPEETKLEVPAPKEDNIQVHLKGGRGPIMVLTCEVGGADASRHFLALEESRITTNTLHTESSNPQSAVQSA